MFIVHVHCSLFMFIVHCSHGATLIFDDVFFVKHRWRWCIRHILFLVLKAFNNLPDTLGSPGHQIYLYYD